MEIDDRLLSQVSDFLKTAEGGRVRSELKSTLGLAPKKNPEPAAENAEKTAPPVAPDALLPGVDMKKLLPLVTAIAGAKTDDRAANLLLALRPLLSPQRAPKIDKAVSLLKIMALLPILEEHGFSVSDFFG